VKDDGLKPTGNELAALEAKHTSGLVTGLVREWVRPEADSNMTGLSMPTYIVTFPDSKYRHLWRRVQSHLHVISSFDFGLTFRPVSPALLEPRFREISHVFPPGSPTLPGPRFREISYAPSDLRTVGRQLLNTIINDIGLDRDITSFVIPLLHTYTFSDPTLVAKIRTLPGTGTNRQSYCLPDVGGGLYLELVGGKHEVAYDCGDNPTYYARSIIGDEPVLLTRPEILFHELVHIEQAALPALSPLHREMAAIIRENQFRLSRNPRLTPRQLRLPDVDQIVQQRGAETCGEHSYE
jgi:hypothetical protein